MDVTFFAHLKKAWKQHLLDYKRSTNALKKHFAKQLKQLVSTVKPDMIVTRFCVL